VPFIDDNPTIFENPIMKTRLPFAFATIVVSGVLLVSSAVHAADAPKVSTFAPAEDLANQVGQYIKAMKSVVADEQEYKDSEGKVVRDASTLAVIALAIGLHDQDSKYKSNAAALLKAAQDVAATKDFESAKKAVDALEAVATKEGTGGGDLKWEKVAPLPELMKQVPMVHNKLKLNVKAESLKKIAKALAEGNGKAAAEKKLKDWAGYSAVIAAIAQGTIADTSATKNADQVKLWQQFSRAMRDDAGAVNAAIHKVDPTAATNAMKKLNQSCEDCHKVFKPEVAAEANKNGSP
jgi:hypothetical protein